MTERQPIGDETRRFLISYSWSHGCSCRSCAAGPTCESNGTIIRAFTTGDPTRVISSAINVLARPQSYPAACGHKCRAHGLHELSVNDAATTTGAVATLHASTCNRHLSSPCTDASDSCDAQTRPVQVSANCGGTLQQNIANWTPQLPQPPAAALLKQNLTAHDHERAEEEGQVKAP
ncbi:hypothetical protein MRX96_029063 [Rhipicephalus microplus]